MKLKPYTIAMIAAINAAQREGRAFCRLRKNHPCYRENTINSAI